MKKTLIAVLLAAAIPVTVLAMPRDGHGMRHHGHHGHHGPAAHALQLNQEQRQKAAELFREQARAHHEIHQRYLDKLPEAERKAMQDELKATREKQQKEFLALLTDDQRKAFEERQQRMEQRRAERAEFLEWKKQKEAASQ